MKRLTIITYISRNQLSGIMIISFCKIVHRIYDVICRKGE